MPALVKIDGARRFRLDPVAEPAQRAVGGERCADAGPESIEGCVSVCALNDRLDLGPVLVVIAQPRHGFEIVVIDVGTRIDDRCDGAFGLVAEIRGEDFDRRLRRFAAQRVDHLDELARTAVGQVVAVDRGDDDVAEPHLRRSDCGMFGFERVNRARHPGLDVAESTGTGAGVAQDHHRRVLFGPAFADVRARRLFAHGVEVQFAHQLARFGVARAGRRLDANPVGLARALARGGGGGCRSVHRAHIVASAPLLNLSTYAMGPP